MARENAQVLGTRVEHYNAVLMPWDTGDGDTNDGGEGEWGEGHCIKRVTTTVSGSFQGGIDAYSGHTSDPREEAVAVLATSASSALRLIDAICPASVTEFRSPGSCSHSTPMWIDDTMNCAHMASS